MNNSRTSRHVLFWLCWILGFTFIQSFGQPVEAYLGWFSYYVITLPVFVGHTYLVVYVLIPRFLNRRLFYLFILFFIVAFYGFSVLELILSNEFIFRWYPTGSEIGTRYLEPRNVIISGLGNLYIVLVFLACRITRNWYLAENERNRLRQEQLRQGIDEKMTKVQPAMLLYAIEHIEKMVERSEKNVTSAIALTSELLHEVMTCHGEKQRPITKEIDLVRKLVSLVSLFREKEPEVEFFLSGDPGRLRLPPLVLFSFVGFLYRHLDHHDTLPEINIEASGFSRMVTIQILDNGAKGITESLESCMQSIRQLEDSFGTQVTITYETRHYGCSVFIRKKNPNEERLRQGKTFYQPADVVHRV